MVFGIHDDKNSVKPADNRHGHLLWLKLLGFLPLLEI